MSKDKAKVPWTEFEFVKDVALAGKLYVNSRYQVIRRDGESGVIWLSIRNLENTHERDWRDFQRIKNELVGPEFEGCELYPAESRLADNANQFHIWCLPDEMPFPFGFDDRLVSECAPGTASQRPFDSDNRPADLVSEKALSEMLDRQGKS